MANDFVCMILFSKISMNVVEKPKVRTVVKDKASTIVFLSLTVDYGSGYRLSIGFEFYFESLLSYNCFLQLEQNTYNTKFVISTFVCIGQPESVLTNYPKYK